MHCHTINMGAALDSNNNYDKGVIINKNLKMIIFIIIIISIIFCLFGPCLSKINITMILNFHL